ncbi:MAG: long-chain fatty acid--CoA ligase [Desulfobacterales bacterium]|jgi:long-chain acyl-CoA synthetase|nr:long-chain fatty acid--CoA ligase [Desulfobacteraceae bacterium]MDD3991362.1 long-chain fatty acid--CoA ligase [Desulfobacteraceae bacterium]MDY0311269.1 long-chain fatty acid--CoA ligase [Desulfobacterales bacterium]
MNTASATPLTIPDVKNFAAIVHQNIRKFGARPVLRTRRQGKWIEIDWNGLGQRMQQAARGLLDLGVAEGEMVCIFSPNKPECTIADLAALNIRGVPVYIYPTNTAGQAEYIVAHSGARILFTGTQEQFDKAAAMLKDGPLHTIVAFDDATDLRGLEGAMHWSAFLDRAQGTDLDAEIDRRLERATVDDLLTLIYTSGTTGEPKGVMLTHASLLHSAAGHDLRLLPTGPEDVSLCFLPLSHVFERIWTYYVLYRGMVNNYLEDPKQIVDFIQEVKPTIMCAVPRFYEKIYAAMMHRLESASPAKQKLFHWAIAVGRERNGRVKDELPVPFWLALRYRLADRLVLGKLRALVGGRIRFFPCAGAPLGEEIEAFFHAAGLFICYGYGLSETTATVTCHEPSRYRFGLVGKPLPGVDVKIGANDEILVRGATVMKGYYKNPAETAAVFEDGWFKTGDTGRFEDNGELRITDRIKDLMKTSGGKYIAPQYVEAMIGADLYIEQIAVVADNRKFVSALIVPEFEALEEYARNHGIAFASREELIAKPQIVRLFEERIKARSGELANYERIIRFTLLAEPFTIDRGEITPTLKLKRKAIKEKFSQAIDAMYDA